MQKQLITLFGLMLLALSANAEPLITFGNKVVKVSPGESFEVEVTAKDLPVTEGGGISLSFDPTVIQATEVRVDTKAWDFASRNGEIDNKEGKISNILFANFKGVSGDTKIATIKFKAVKKGDSDLKLLGIEKMPFASEGKKLAVKFKGAKVKVKGKPKNR